MRGTFNIATVLVPLGLIFVGTIFLTVGMTGDRRITPLIFGGLCAAGGIAAIIALFVRFFRDIFGKKANSHN